ncbi:caspase family protein [Seonamhaeicola sp. MEBiC1930]|uniref:caspase family protein n=1 Tax=Seonamhaeicola sp. MEBiC01930 TaxID=2976768 RepID=UPI003246B0A6
MKRLFLLFFICFHFGFTQEAKIEVQETSRAGMPRIDSENGLLLTYGSYDNAALKVWDLHSGFLLKTIDYPALVNNIFIDKENNRTYIGDKNGVDVLDNKTLKIIKEYPIKFLKNFVYDSQTKLIYFVSGDAEFDGNHFFSTLNPKTGSIERSTTTWPGLGSPMNAKLISVGDNSMIEFNTDRMEKIYFHIQSYQFQFFNSEHVGFFNNLDLLYFDIIDDKHIKVIRYSFKENKSVWETILEAGRTKRGVTPLRPTFSFTPDKTRLWVAPSQAPMYELNTENGEFVGKISSSIDKRIVTADNNFVYALEPLSDTYGSPAYFNKYRRYSKIPLTTYGYPIFNISSFEVFKVGDERGMIYRDLNSSIGSVTINNAATTVTSYHTTYYQKFGLWGGFYPSNTTKKVYYGMGEEEGVKQFTLGKPLSFKHVYSPQEYFNNAVANSDAEIVVTQNGNGFNISTLNSKESLFADDFKNVTTVSSFNPLIRNKGNEVAFLILDEVVPEAVYKRRIDYYDYEKKELLWQKEGEYEGLFFMENESKLLTKNVEKKQIEILNVADGTISRSFAVPILNYTYDMAINSSESLILFSDYKSILQVYDIKSGALVSETSKFNEEFVSCDFINDEVYVTLTNGHFRFYNVHSHEEILRLYIFLDNEWVAHTPSGLFEGSQKAWNRVLFTKGTDIIPLNQIFNDFYTPHLVNTVLKSQNVESKRSVYNLNKAPEVIISYNDGKRSFTTDSVGGVKEIETSVKSNKITLSAEAFGDSIKELRLYHNGKRIISNGNDSSYTVNFIDGENTLTAVAINSQNTESAPRKIIAKYRAKKTEPEENDIQVHLLTIGIDVYKNPKYNLNYAVADAIGFQESVLKGIERISSKVNIYDIKNKDADKAEIISTLNTISEKSRPQDVFVFYYAGHGVMSEGGDKDFFLIPHDVTQLFGNDDVLITKGISATEIKDLSAIIPAQKQLYVLDACQSGGAIGTLVARGAAEEKAIAQLARSTGTHWLTASGSDQYAIEFSKLGHGVFTYALLEALSGKADNGDSRITVNELKAYIEIRVPEISEEYKGSPQYPSSFGFGQDFPVSTISK